MTGDMWHVTGDTWQVTRDLMNKSINDGGDCRTAPATPGRLKREKKMYFLNSTYDLTQNNLQSLSIWRRHTCVGNIKKLWTRPRSNFQPCTPWFLYKISWNMKKKIILWNYVNHKKYKTTYCPLLGYIS